MADDTVFRPGYWELVRVSARIGVLSFGGPAGQIALMHRELVDERRWVEEDEFLHALNLCHLLPGPEAQQLATWIGWKLHGWRGGIVAGGLFVVPGALIMLALTMLYAFAADLAWFAALFLGIKAAILAIVAQALVRIARRALKAPLQRAIALGAFIALFGFDAPFPLVVLAALGIGAVVGAKRPKLLMLNLEDSGRPVHPTPWRSSLSALPLWLLIWAAPMAAVWLLLGSDHVLWEIGLFFSQLAVVTFGGAYAVLTYMAQEAVESFGWLAAGEMADGLGLAETTPGPLIMVTQFVGYLAAFRAPEPFTPVVAGTLGALLTTWVTFAPCFLWIFAFAPWMDHLRRVPALAGGLASVTAAVVGVIANLGLWFTLHVLFAQLTDIGLGPLQLQWPEWATFDWRAGLIAASAFAMIFGLRWGLVATLAAAASMGLMLSIPGF
jgi:chromate transporter